MDKLGISEYELKEWINTLGSMPIERIAHADHSESYEIAEAHVLLLENGKYALVSEIGCSCYDPSDAEIDLHPTRLAALEAFDRWKLKYTDGRYS